MHSINNQVVTAKIFHVEKYKARKEKRVNTLRDRKSSMFQSASIFLFKVQCFIAFS